MFAVLVESHALRFSVCCTCSSFIFKAVWKFCTVWNRHLQLLTLQALIDRPDEERRVINFKRLALTDIKIDVPRLAKKKVLTEAFTSAGVEPYAVPHLKH